VVLRVLEAIIVNMSTSTSLFIVLNIRFNIIANVTRTYRVTHKEQSNEKYISMTYIRGAFSK
jgi:hypothetical protein